MDAEIIEDAASEPDIQEADADQQDETPPETDAPETPSLTSHSAKDANPPNRSTVMPMIIGGVVAAALGFGAAQFAQPLFGSSNDAVLGELQRQTTTHSDQIDTNRSGVERIQAAAESTAASLAAQSTSQSALDGRIATLETSLSGLNELVSGFNARIADLEKRPMTAALSSEAISAYENEIAELKKSVTEQLEAAQSLKDTSDVSARDALARATLTRVISLIESGTQYRAALDDMVSATGLVAPVVLTEHADIGVPTVAALQNKFPQFARDALARARSADPDADAGSKFGNFLRNQLGARSVAPKDGDDPDAILSRVEAALRDGDLAGVLAEAETLPEVSQDAMAPWVGQVATRRDALAEIDVLSNSLNTN